MRIKDVLMKRSRLTNTIARLFFLGLFLFSTQAISANPAAPLLNANTQINLAEAQRLSKAINTVCGSAFKGQQANQCRTACGNLYNPTQSLSLTIDRANVSREALQNSATNYFNKVDHCAKAWPSKRGPNALKPFLELAQIIKSGKLPKPHTSQQVASGNSKPKPGPAFNPFQSGNKAPATSNKKIKKLHTPYIELSDMQHMMGTQDCGVGGKQTKN